MHLGLVGLRWFEQVCRTLSPRYLALCHRFVCRFLLLGFLFFACFGYKAPFLWTVQVSCLTSALAKCHVGIGENDHVKPAAKVVQKIKENGFGTQFKNELLSNGPLEITFQPLLSAVKGLSFHVSFRICPIQPHSNYLKLYTALVSPTRLTIAKQSRSCLRFETCQLIALVLIGRGQPCIGNPQASTQLRQGTALERFSGKCSMRYA